MTNLGIAPTPAEFRHAMRAVVGNCSVITTGLGDAATGLVVTSAISLSAEPPLLLACVNRASSSWPVLQQAGFFGWSSLGAAHQSVAERFSGWAVCAGLRGLTVPIGKPRSAARGCWWALRWRLIARWMK